MNKAEYKGLKGAAISILWIIEKTDKPFRKSEFFRLFTDKTITAAFADLLDLGIIIKVDNKTFAVSPDYRSESGIFPTPTTTGYINRLVELKDIKSSSKPESFRPEIYEALGMVGEPVRTELSCLEHMTTEYTEDHIKKWRKEKKGVGLLVHRLRSNDPAPNGQKPHDPEQFTNGKYKDFIKS